MVLRHSSGARNRTEVYDSLALRLPEFLHKLSQQDFMRDYVELLQVAQNPQTPVGLLGLSGHPSASSAKSAWGPIYRKIIYHADTRSLYVEPPPTIIFKTSPPPGCREPADDGEGIAASAICPASGAYEVMKKIELLKFLNFRLCDLSRGSTRYVFCCKLKLEALQLLVDM